jgi:hypothetical protein
VFRLLQLGWQLWHTWCVCLLSQDFIIATFLIARSRPVVLFNSFLLLLVPQVFSVALYGGRHTTAITIAIRMNPTTFIPPIGWGSGGVMFYG